MDEIIISFSARQRLKVTQRLERATTDLLNKLRVILFEVWLLVFEGNRIPLEKGKRLVEFELWILEKKSKNVGQ